MKYIKMMDGATTDYLHGRYMLDTNIECQAIFFQVFYNDKPYTQIDCMEQ